MKISKFIYIALMICFFNLYASYGYSLTAVVMSDDELDLVYAGGLNFDFDNFLGNMPSVSNNLNSSDTSKNGLDNVQMLSNSGVKIMSPRGVSSPTPPRNVVKPATVSLPFGPSVPGKVVAPKTSTPLETSSALSNSNSKSSPNVAVSNNSAVVPLSVAKPVGVLGVTAATPPKQVAVVAAPTRPMVLDVVAGSNGNSFGVVVGGDSSFGTIDPKAFTANSLGANSVNVTGESQANLSALVNVNAAGSVVPIQLNLTVLMNSSVGSLNNQNNLTLQSLMTVQVR